MTEVKMFRVIKLLTYMRKKKNLPLISFPSLLDPCCAFWRSCSPAWFDAKTCVRPRGSIAVFRWVVTIQQRNTFSLLNMFHWYKHATFWSHTATVPLKNNHKFLRTPCCINGGYRDWRVGVGDIGNPCLAIPAQKNWPFQVQRGQLAPGGVNSLAGSGWWGPVVIPSHGFY